MDRRLTAEERVKLIAGLKRHSQNPKLPESLKQQVRRSLVSMKAIHARELRKAHARSLH